MKDKQSHFEIERQRDCSITSNMPGLRHVGSLALLASCVRPCWSIPSDDSGTSQLNMIWNWSLPFIHQAANGKPMLTRAYFLTVVNQPAHGATFKMRPMQRGCLCFLNTSRGQPRRLQPTNMYFRTQSGGVLTCDKNDNPLSVRQSFTEATACDNKNPGNAYLCSDYQPQPISDSLSYASVMTSDWTTCCQCYELSFMNGPTRGKSVQVQVIDNNGGSRDRDSGRDRNGNRSFAMMVPGASGGVQTCQNQYGNRW